MHVLTVTVQSLFAGVDVTYVLAVMNVPLIGGSVVGDDGGDGVAVRLCCVDSVSVGGCDVTAVVIGDTDVLQSIAVDISGDEDTFEDVVIIIVVVVVVVVVVMEELVVSLEDGIDVTAVQKFIHNSVTHQSIIFCKPAGSTQTMNGTALLESRVLLQVITAVLLNTPDIERLEDIVSLMSAQVCGILLQLATP